MITEILNFQLAMPFLQKKKYALLSHSSKIYPPILVY